MSYSFEEIRGVLKQYTFEENVAPPKLVVAGKKFLDIDHKKRPASQFIIGVKEYYASQQSLFDRFLDQVEVEAGRRPFSFAYDDKQTLEIVIRDFEDYFDIKLGNKLIQKLDSSAGNGALRYGLVIMIVESYFYYEDPKGIK